MQPGDGGPVEHSRPLEGFLRKFGPQVGLQFPLSLHVDVWAWGLADPLRRLCLSMS
mgnify:FL=1